MKAAALALLLTTSPASAAVYQWQWSGTFSGAGTLTTEQLPNKAYETVIDITGELNGLTIFGIQSDWLSPSNRLFPDTATLVDWMGIGFTVEPPNHFHPNPVGYAAYAVALHGCTWTALPCFYIEAREITYTGNHSFADSGTFSLVPGPIVGAGLPGLLLAGAGLLTFLRLNRNVRN